MTTIIYILAYLILIGEIVWRYTSVKCDIPLLEEIGLFVVCFLPGIHVIAAVSFPGICVILYSEGILKLKDNWFNRKFLNHE